MLLCHSRVPRWISLSKRKWQLFWEDYHVLNKKGHFLFVQEASNQYTALVVGLFWFGFSIYAALSGGGWFIWGPLLLFFFGNFESVAQAILPDSKETYAAFDKGGTELFKFRYFAWSKLALAHAKERDPRVSHVSKVVLDA